MYRLHPTTTNRIIPEWKPDKYQASNTAFTNTKVHTTRNQKHPEERYITTGTLAIKTVNVNQQT
jgi:hypothetical protein